MRTNQATEKNRVVLQSRSNDLVNTLGDFFIDLHYRDERTKIANPEIQKTQKKEDSKMLVEEKIEIIPPELEKENPLPGVDLSKLLTNPPSTSQPAQNWPQTSQQPSASQQQVPPKSILSEPKTKGTNPMSELLGGLTKKDKPSVTFDHLAPGTTSKQEAKPTQPVANNFQLPVIPENPALKSLQNSTQGPQKMVTPFYSSKQALYDEEDDPLGGNLLSPGTTVNPFSNTLPPSATKPVPQSLQTLKQVLPSVPEERKDTGGDFDVF